MLLRTLLALCAILCCNAALAGLKEGYAALARKDYVTAMKEYRPLAERGNAEAQYRVGRMYEFGQGVPQDKALGIAWVRKAAEQNHADAQYELGVVYGTGDGVKQDDVQAVAWFRKAAMQGDSMAQYNLGQSYANGQGVNKDYAQAVDWWRKSAAQGNADAQFKLGVVYYTGQGVEKDPVLALANATIAARSGDKEKVAFPERNDSPRGNAGFHQQLPHRVRARLRNRIVFRSAPGLVGVTDEDDERVGAAQLLDQAGERGSRLGRDFCGTGTKPQVERGKTTKESGIGRHADLHQRRDICEPCDLKVLVHVGFDLFAVRLGPGLSGDDYEVRPHQHLAGAQVRKRCAIDGRDDTCPLRVQRDAAAADGADWIAPIVDGNDDRNGLRRGRRATGKLRPLAAEAQPQAGPLV